jgi:hypothetical protein
MPVTVLLIVAIVLFIGLLFAVDQLVKAIKRGRRRASATRRLDAAEARGRARHKQRRAAAEASAELTSVMPTIHDLDPRHVE